MKLSRILLFSLLLVAGVATQSIAQKVGHLNANELLVNYPEMKAANSELEAYKKQKTSKLEADAKKLQEFYISTMKLVQEGKLSLVQQQQKESDLQKKQQALQKAEAEAQQEIIKRQSDLYEPIITKVNDAIKRVGEANGYDYIFDSSIGALIHFKDSDDVSALVKKELGM